MQSKTEICVSCAKDHMMAGTKHSAGECQRFRAVAQRKTLSHSRIASPKKYAIGADENANRQRDEEGVEDVDAQTQRVVGNEPRQAFGKVQKTSCSRCRATATGPRR